MADDAVRVESDVVHGARFDRIAEAEKRVLVLAADDGNAAKAFRLGVAVDVVGEDG